jgi:hypothetical protein
MPPRSACAADAPKAYDRRRVGLDPGTNDLLLAFMRYAPLLFVFAGILVVAWLSRQRSAQELQSEVLAALSDTEVMSARALRSRLSTADCDMATLERILEELRLAGLVVRWYETVEAERELVYRRVTTPTAS